MRVPTVPCNPKRPPCAVGTRAIQVLAASDRAALKTCPGLSVASPGLRRRFLMAVRTGMGTNYPSGSSGGCGGRFSSLGADTGGLRSSGGTGVNVGKSRALLGVTVGSSDPSASQQPAMTTVQTNTARSSIGENRAMVTF